MRLFAGELKKIWTPSLAVVAAFLLALNAGLIYTGERTRDRFSVSSAAFEEAFQAADSLDAAHYRETEEGRIREHLASYGGFVAGIRERADRITVVFGSGSHFLTRNAERTSRDFEALGEVKLAADTCTGIEAFSEWQADLLITAAFVALLIYTVVGREWEKGYLSLFMGTKNGRLPLALSRLAALSVTAFPAGMLFSAASAAVFGLLYGFGDLSRSIQSVPAFRECVYRLDVGGFLLRVLLIRAAIAVFLAALFFLMACLIRRGHILILSELAFCGAEFALERGIPLAGTLNWLKCVNVFWLWQPRGVFGTYCNLDFFGYPVSKDAAGAVILAAFGLVVSCGGLCAFCLPKPPARTGGMNVRALKKGRPFFKAERLLAELKKTLAEEKKWIAAVLLIVWAAFSVREVSKPVYYSPKEAAYHYYLSCVQGRVTDGTREFMENENRRFDDARAEMAALSGQPGSGERVMELGFFIEAYEEGFRRAEEQYEGALRTKEPYMADEMSYDRFWHRTFNVSLHWMVCMLAFAVLISGIFTLDGEKGLLRIYRVTKTGERGLFLSKLKSVLALGLPVYAAVLLPDLIRLFRIDGFRCLAAPMDNISYLEAGPPLTILGAVLISCAAVLLGMAALACLVLVVSRRSGKQFTVLLAGTAAVLLIVLWMNVSGVTYWSLPLLLYGGV